MTEETFTIEDCENKEVTVTLTVNELSHINAVCEDFIDSINKLNPPEEVIETCNILRSGISKIFSAIFNQNRA